MSEPIKKASLRTLRSEVGEDAFIEIVDAYVQSGDELIEMIRSAVAAGDARTAGSASHSLKSASALLGGVALSEACAELEAAARVGTSAREIKPLAARIEKLYGPFCKTLNASLART